MIDPAQRQSAVDVLLPSVREIRFLDETQSLHPTRGGVELEESIDSRIKGALQRYGLHRYPVHIHIRESIDRPPQLHDDYTYEIRVSAHGIEIRANSTWGGISACSVVAALSGSDDALPFCHLIDGPAYPWRGLMIDVSRHFISIPTLKQTLDLMACYRLNVLHLNLSNDQACRFRSTNFPRLAASESYSSEELQDLICFAADRAIRIVPELDVPGHTTSWVWAYPEWGAEQLKEPSTGFGVHEACLDPTKPEVLEAIKLVFDELAELFPDSHIHIGGDEVNPTWWNRNQHIQAWMAERGMATSHDLQTWFIKELSAHIMSRAKQVIGWDEVLAPDLATGFTIQAWRGMRARDVALKGGYGTIVSAPYYLDLFLPADYHYRYLPSMSLDDVETADAQALADPRLAHVSDGLRWQSAFGSFASLVDREGGDVLGGEACMWSEIVDDETLHTRVWSRMPAIAERFWSGDESLNEAQMYERLEPGVAFWSRKFGIGNLLNLPGELAPPVLRSLIDQLEPVKWYSRLIGMDRMNARTSGQVESAYARPYDIHTELNRVIDHLPPESFEARRVDAMLTSDKPITKWCDGWKTQAQAFEDCVKVEPRLIELQEASRHLAQLAAIHQEEAPVNMSLADPIGEYLLPIATSVLNHVILRIANRFGAVQGVVEEIKRGHINDSFAIDRTYLLQRINSTVFDVSAVLRNRRTLDPFIRDFVPRSFDTSDGSDHVVGVKGEVWRTSEYIEARNFDVLPTELCEEAGRAFGRFLTQLKECNERPIPVIPGFHNLHTYLTEIDALSPTSDALDWVDFVTKRRSSTQSFDDDEFQVIHGDCKVNNLLFELEAPKVARIIDLDTLMWGHPAWDFGDLIRSVLTGSVNAEEEHERIRLTTQGFVSCYPINDRARETFANAPSYMSFMLGVRFLADHFRGDTYFKVGARGDNLERATEQFELYDRLLHAATEINDWLEIRP